MLQRGGINSRSQISQDRQLTTPKTKVDHALAANLQYMHKVHAKNPGQPIYISMLYPVKMAVLCIVCYVSLTSAWPGNGQYPELC